MSEKHPRTERFFAENQAVLEPVLNQLLAHLILCKAIYEGKLADGTLFGNPESMALALEARGVTDYTEDDIMDIVLAESVFELLWPNPEVKPPNLQLR